MLTKMYTVLTMSQTHCMAISGLTDRTLNCEPGNIYLIFVECRTDFKVFVQICALNNLIKINDNKNIASLNNSIVDI